MKLVGASNWFVRAPFLVESLLYSLLAVGLVAALTIPLVTFLEPRFNFYFDGESTGLTQYFLDNGFMIFGAQFAVLSVINIISTSMAMRKYLKV